MAAGDGENPIPKFLVYATPSCQQAGGRIVVNVVTDVSEAIQYSIIGQNGGYSANYTGPELNYTFDNVPNDLYEIHARALTIVGAEDSTEANINCVGNDAEPPVNDLTVTLTPTNPTEAGLADGKVLINVSTSYPPFNTELDFLGYVPGKIEYTGLMARTYTINVIDAAGFTKSVPFTLTDPVEPPPGPTLYYAVGGVLPNPIEFTLNFDPLDLGNPKNQHYVDVEILSAGNVIGQLRQRIRNGVTKVDVAAYLKREISLQNTSNLLFSEDVLLPFTYRYRENYNGVQGNWKTDKQPRYAVQAALQDYSSDFNAYVVRAPYIESEPQADEYYKFLTDFKIPVKFACYGTFLTTIIDNSITIPLYFERTYFASNGDIVERRSELIPATDYGKLLRLQILDDVLPCANYIEAVITDVYRVLEGTCPDDVPPPVGMRIFDQTFDSSFE